MASDDEPGDNISMAVNTTDADDSLIGAGDISPLEVLSPTPEKMRELGNAGILTRIELDLAYASEKLLNLDILLMHVATEATDSEALSLVNDDTSLESLDKPLEFDLLSAILDSEVKQMDDFMDSVQMDIVDAREKISYWANLEESFLELKEMLHDSEESLRKLQDQVSEMRMQSSKFRSTIAFSIQGSCNDENTDFSEGFQIIPTDAKLKMQTADHQRHILRMLEKSLAREMDLENKLSELLNNKEELLMKMSYAEREFFCVEEMAEVSTEKLFEAENLAEILLSDTKKLTGKLQLTQFNLNSSKKREDQMRSSICSIEKRMEDSEVELKRVKAVAEASQSQQDSLQSKIGELESVIEELKADLLKAEANAESAELRCSLLDETNLELTQEIGLLRNSEEKVDLLEKQLKQSEVQLRHSKAMIEANQEKQTMLYSALGDMENLINDLKAKVVKAESRAEIAESNCITLTETNSDLNEALAFLKSRIECLEESIHQADEAKVTTTRNIGIRTKVITDLVMQLGMERERLQIQISSLIKENSFLARKYSRSNASDPPGLQENENKGESGDYKNDAEKTHCSKSSEEAVTEASASSFEVDDLAPDPSKRKPFGENETGFPVSAEDEKEVVSKLETVWTIEASQLSFKYVITAIIILIISLLVVYTFQKEGGTL